MSYESFTAEVSANQQVEHAPDASTSLAVEQSQLSVRNRGCFVLNATLLDPKTGELVQVLFSEADSTKPRLSASHPMSPVGPYDGIGGQHGYPRWVDYEATLMPEGNVGNEGISFRAHSADAGQVFRKTFELSKSGLYTHTVVDNTGDTPLHTSLGAHDYYTLADENPEGLLLNGKPLDEVFEAGAQDAIMHGETYILDMFGLPANVRFPAGHEVRIDAEGVANGEVANHLLGLMVWHRPGTESICFEPTFGYKGDGSNDLLHIDPGERAMLMTQVELV